MSDLRTPEQREAQDRRQREREAEERALARDYFLLFGSEVGRRVLKDIERQGFLYRTTLSAPHADAPIDHFQTAANEGKRQLVVEIKAQIERGGQSQADAVPERATTAISN